MKKVKLFEEFVNDSYINEGETNPIALGLFRELEMALNSNFNDVEFAFNGKENKYYYWKESYISTTNSYQAQDWTWLDSKRAKILQDCNFSSLFIVANIKYYEEITNAKFMPKTQGYIGVSANNSVYNVVHFDLSDPKKNNIAKSVKEFIKKSQKNPISDDMMDRLLQFWKPSKSDYKDISSRHQGIGRHASTHITKSYDNVYVIKDLDKAFGKTTEEIEKIIRTHYSFKKDRLDFDWENGLMIVGGTYTEVWD